MIDDKHWVFVDNTSQSLEFNTDGLYYAEFLDYIFRGHFENIQLTREEMEFITIFDAYLRTYGKDCKKYLPANSVPIMNLECAVETVTRNGYGIETNRYCSEYRTVPSGLYARPELYSAKVQVEKLQSGDALRTAVNMMTNPNAFGNSVDMIHKINGLQNDLLQIFQLNSCNSEGVRRFEENLRLFALNKPSIRMKEESKYAKMKNTGGPSGTQNFSKLIDDLVINQSRTWAFNRYIPGSISDVSVLSEDDKGRPAVIKANYTYNGFSGRSNGWVKITFKNGLPDCLYFFDFPNNCKGPSSSIVASYAQGRYSID
ncbi:hypothetical protein [Salinimicrobium soli]|uniref:hypothetical protein n=1 Tax=Salinimicrobium soli TaxID=1254399 RepID=UPI003AB05437